MSYFFFTNALVLKVHNFINIQRIVNVNTWTETRRVYQLKFKKHHGTHHVLLLYSSVVIQNLLKTAILGRIFLDFRLHHQYRRNFIFFRPQCRWVDVDILNAIHLPFATCCSWFTLSRVWAKFPNLCHFGQKKKVQKPHDVVQLGNKTK